MERLADPSKRRFFRGSVKTKQELRLPWVINEAVFTSGCTQCQDCISSCESNIIVKGEDGFPKVDFSLGECTFCNKCIETCQQPLFSGTFPCIESHEGSSTEAAAKVSIKENTLDKNKKAWPVTLEISDKCLAKNNIYCQSCRDECETSVIKFNYLNSSIPQPSLNDLDCTQCGACIKSCPQDALAFTFEPNAS
ncbi:ferredoxin-type protein NapF [Colwellia psychrerythraea]|uniref:Ferredoxin-type protein NapF n=1 Tax=Colwellia psychrerythraea TaxID=28229 RepID=A0A099KJY1_COLPS|nr:ferredoxin-type protein NapF [Colwellia psychrerythraea]KGJ90565.1 4Fe-4S ferredoxin, iron-sulpur binding domain-containing protein [Colwellia psychrerythraea]